MKDGEPPRGTRCVAELASGSALAIVISWSLHQSILWAVIHGVFSWFYVIYYAFTR